MTDPQSAATTTAQPGNAAPSTDTAPGDTAPSHQEEQRDDVVAQIQAATAWLGAAEDTDSPTELPLTELADRLTALHGQLQGALSELDRT